MKHFSIILSICILLLAAGCTPAGKTGDDAKYPQETWGEWKSLDQMETWVVTSNSAYMNNLSKSPSSIKKLSDSILEITMDGTKRHLYAIRTASSEVYGTINNLNSSSKAIGNGWLEVVIQNTNNPQDRHVVTTDENGKFTVSDVIPGDSYTVTPKGDKAVSITPDFDGQNLGIFNMNEGYNFKVTLENVPEVMFVGDTYKVNLVVTNTGDKDCTGAKFSLSFDEGLDVEVDNEENRMGDYYLLRTVVPQETKKIPLVIKCTDLGATVTKDIHITIKDIQNKEWEDSVSTKFYSGKTIITLSSESGRPINGFVIGNKHSFTIKNQVSCAIEVPTFDGEYTLVFAGAKATLSSNTECAYSIGVNEKSVGQKELIASLSDTSVYEPNDTEEEAYTINSGENIVAYLHSGDIDYYKVSARETVQDAFYESIKDKIITCVVDRTQTSGSNTMIDPSEYEAFMTLYKDATLMTPSEEGYDLKNDYLILPTNDGKEYVLELSSSQSGCYMEFSVPRAPGDKQVFGKVIQTSWNDDLFYVGLLDTPMHFTILRSNATSGKLILRPITEGEKEKITVANFEKVGDSFTSKLLNPNEQHGLVFQFGSTLKDNGAYVHVEFLTEGGYPSTQSTNTMYRIGVKTLEGTNTNTIETPFSRYGNITPSDYVLHFNTDDVARAATLLVNSGVGKCQVRVTYCTSATLPAGVQVIQLD
ncbi:MAG: hypothetical protein KBS81_00095 [Spirochaetales bacterium]|nr:hypothetical protein [Candidatus Physcosoma equi]